MIPPHHKALNICLLPPLPPFPPPVNKGLKPLRKVVLIWFNKLTKITLSTFRDTVLKPCV